MNKKIRDENTDMLMKAVMSAQSLEECYDFFSDLCSEAEIRTMSQRFHVARLLKENRLYSEIVQEAGVGTATISKVRNSLNGGNGGYEKAIDRTLN